MLNPINENYPLAIVPVVNKPILCYQLEYLERYVKLRTECIDNCVHDINSELTSQVRSHCDSKIPSGCKLCSIL